MFKGTKTVSEKKRFSFAEAKQIGDALGIRWDKFDVEPFTMGLNVELEHGRRDPETDVTHDEPLLTGKIAWAHLNEIPNSGVAPCFAPALKTKPKEKGYLLC